MHPHPDSAITARMNRSVHAWIFTFACVAGGCITVNQPSKEPAEATDTAPTQTREEEHFPKTSALLKQAQEALTEDGAQTVELAKQARETLHAEFEGHGERYENEFKRLGTSADVLRSMGHAAVAPLDAMLFWGFRGFALEHCKKVLPSLSEPCEQHTRDMQEALPQLIEYDEYWGRLKFKTTVGGSSLAKASLLKEMDQRVREAEQTPLGGRFTPTSRKTVGDKVVLSVDGETTKESLRKCHDTGVDVRIGKADFDLQRCRKVGFTSYAAHFRIELPADSVEELEPGDTVYVLFEPKDYSASGNTRTIKNARFAFREGAGARQW